MNRTLEFKGKTLYHSTKAENIPSILREGLKSNGFGIVYLAPTLESVYKENRVILEVNPIGNELSSFEDCMDWEVLCWGKIEADKIKIVSGEDTK